MSIPKVAIVTGSNRGIGLEAVRLLLRKTTRKVSKLPQFNGAVYLTSRDQTRGEQAVKSLQSDGLNPEFHVLDTSIETSINNFRDHILERYGGVDIFIHNAGILFKSGDPTPYPERARLTVETNYCNSVKVCNAFLPIMKPGGRFILMSSGLSLVALQGCREDVQSFFKSPNLTENDLSQKMRDYIDSAQKGKHAENGFDDHAYGMSKLGVNALTKLLAKQLRDAGKNDILVNCCCPGWVRTSMGGEGATFSPEQGAEIPIKLALLPEGALEPNGEFYQRNVLKKWYN